MQRSKIWALAGPVILANLSVPLLGAVDTAVIGHLDDAYNLAAVAIGSTIIQFIYWAFGFLRMGIGGLAAQALGSKDAPEVRALFTRGALIGLFVGLVLWAIQSQILWLALNLFDGSAATKSLASLYFEIRIWSAPAVLVNYCLIGWFIGMQNTRAVLYLQVFMNGLNIVLDLYFVLNLGWGVAGVAIATLISELAAVIIGLLVYRREVNRFDPGGKSGSVWDVNKLKRTLGINIDIFIRTVCLLFAFAFFTSQASGFGDITIAAHLVLIQFQFFLSFGLDGFAHAAEALVGNSIGSKNRLALRHAVNISSKWAAGVAGAYMLVYAIAGEFIIGLLTSIPEVRIVATDYLIWMIISPATSVWSFMLDGIFIGATRSAEMRNGMLISLIVFISAALLLKPIMGYGGVWVAFTFFMIMRAITLGIFYPRVEIDVK